MKTFAGLAASWATFKGKKAASSSALSYRCLRIWFSGNRHIVELQCGCWIADFRGPTCFMLRSARSCSFFNILLDLAVYFISTMDQMALCNGKGVAISDKPTENHHLTLQSLSVHLSSGLLLEEPQLYCVVQSLPLWSPSSSAAAGSCLQPRSSNNPAVYCPRSTKWQQSGPKSVNATLKVEINQILIEPLVESVSFLL